MLAETGRPRTVVYAYPRTGEPDKPSPEGWDMIPGARGCTPQSCSFRDHHQELLELGAEVFGLSSQTTAYQQEMVARLHLPFEVLSDADLRFAKALRLPTFEVPGEDGVMTLIKRLTLILHGWSDRARLLSGVPARPERGGHHRLAARAPDPRLETCRTQTLQSRARAPKCLQCRRKH